MVTIDFDKFISNKKAYDSLNQALKLANRVYNVSEDVKDQIIIEKTQLNASRVEYEKAIAKSMPRNSNLGYIGEGWYGIWYINDSNQKALKIELLNASDVSIIERDPGAGLHRRSDLEAIIPAIVDGVRLELYKEEIKAMAQLRLAGLGVLLPKVRENTSEEVAFSQHARKRYVMRRIGVRNESEADNYLRLNVESVNSSMAGDLGTAELLWRGEDGVQYMLDVTNGCYVINGNKVITFYEIDFGFTRDINRMVIKEHIKEVRRLHELSKELEEDHQSLISETNTDLINIDSRVAMLRAELEELEAIKTHKQSQLVVSGKSLNTSRATFNSAQDKLFKKYEV